MPRTSCDVCVGGVGTVVSAFDKQEEAHEKRTKTFAVPSCHRSDDLLNTQI